jgi:hypothetical protein
VDEDPTVSAGVPIHRTLSTRVKVVDDSARKLAFIISSGSVDRDNDTINPKGWSWTAWLDAGAPILYGHDQRSLPVAFGEAAPTLVEGTKLRNVAHFVEPGIYPMADLVYSLAKPKENRSGGLRAASVGFLPKKWIFNQERGGYDFTEQEGLEWSIVAVPSNRDAVQQAKASAAEDGLDAIKILRNHCEQTLDALGDEPGLWVPKREALEMFKLLKAPSVTVTRTLGAASISTTTPADYVAVVQKAADVVLAVTKRGRVLSQANEERLRAARGHGDSATGAVSDLCAALDDVLAQLPSMDPEDDPMDPAECAVPEKAAEPNHPFLLIVPEPKEPTFTVDPKALAASVSAAVSEAVAERIRRAAGRLD